jgi:thioredoxin-like negative regulator of GroEL
VEKIAKGRWTTIKMNIKNPEFASLTSQITTMPAIALFKDGVKVYEEAGRKSDAQIKNLIANYFY